MFDVTCLDTYGEVITHLTQWDTDQSLIIKNTGLSSSPVFHFYNQNSKEAYVVSSTLENDVITVHIPNVLLQEGIPIVACLYAYSSLTSGKTLATVKIPVRPRPKPSEYKYVENIDVISVVQLKNYIADEIASLEDLKVELNQDISTIKSEFSDIKEEFDGYKPLIDAKIPIAEKGAANGVAELDTSGKVPAAQLPSYVDDVIEGTYATFPKVGETGKIYLDTETNFAWRWSGTRYAQIAASLALGETASTAYAGDKGKKNADDITALTTIVAENTTDVKKLRENYYTNLIPLATIVSGKFIDGSHKWCDSLTFTSFILKKDDIISLDKIKVWSNQKSFAIGFYSSEEPSDNTYIGGKIFSSTNEASIYENVKIPSNAVIIVICNRNSSSEDIEISGFPHLDHVTAKLNINSLRNDVNAIEDKTQNDILHTCKYENAYINAQGEIVSSTLWQDYLLYDIYDQLTFKTYTNDVNLYAVGFYSSRTPAQDTFITGIKFKENGLSEITIDKSSIPNITKSIVLCSRTATGNETALLGTRNISSDIVNLKNIVSDLKRVDCGVGNVKAIYKNIPNTNDFTIIKDEIWFAENIYENGVATENTKLHRYKIVNNTLFYIDTIMSDFGHWNVVDYNEDNDCLVFGNASNSTSTDGNFFSVVKNPLALSGTVNLATCGIKYPVDIGYKVQAVWGDNNFGKNNIVYLISNNASKITKVMLKRDSDGSFTVNETTGYGEFIVLDTKELQDVDYGVGGADFWGDTLYIGIGVKYRLAKMSMTDYSIEEIEKKYYYDNGTSYDGSTQGIHIDNNYLWWFVNVAGQTENYLIQYYIGDIGSGSALNKAEKSDVSQELLNKVDKVTGKGLSANDYTDEEKQKNQNNADAVSGLATAKADKTMLSDYVKKTDYASADSAGVVKVDSSNDTGIAINPSTEVIYTNPATTLVISSRTSVYKPITPATLNHAVKAALTDSNRITGMTDTEKANARDVIGAEQKTIINTETSTISLVTVNIPYLGNQMTICDHDILTLMIYADSTVPVGYECAFSFQSGETATTISYPGDSFKFVGVDCDADGDFVPSANTNYEVSIRNLSTNTASPLLVARVGVY